MTGRRKKDDSFPGVASSPTKYQNFLIMGKVGMKVNTSSLLIFFIISIQSKNIIAFTSLLVLSCCF